MIRRATIAATIFIGFAGSQAVAWDQDFFGNYFQRKDTITSGAGDARDVNAANQIINPWPPNVGDRRIPGNGERAAGAAERYRTNTPAATPCAPMPTFDIRSGGIRSETARDCAINNAIRRAGETGNVGVVVTAPSR
jgi:hypothetical protein